MRIGMVCYPTYGGSGVVATELGKALAAAGHEVHFIAYDTPFRLDHFQRNVFVHQVRARLYPVFHFLPYESALTGKIATVAQTAGLDLVHAHYAIPHASAAILARQIVGRKLPVVTTLHGTDITLVGKESVYEPVVTYAVNQSDAVTCVSDYLRRATQENFSVSRSICVIPNFVDLNRFQPSSSSEGRRCFTGDDPHARVVMHVSNFRRVKRTKDVFEAFDLARRLTRRALYLVLVGDGPERDELERLVRKRGANDAVFFLGNQEAVEEILPKADVFLLPSEVESFGLSALEAMACGVPVVGSDAGGLPEVVKNGKEGFLCTVGDIESMARAIAVVVEDDERWRDFSQAARAKALAFAQEKIVPRYEKLYGDLLEGIIPSP
ncbi:MAG: N-acetyl-alpha-D-glucosaminyl L-malate synthase BshA [Bacteroidia bacterium]|nr:N-acetyl-alpha-D-glucosaminyl L-malate synthase BshA [Bacteroidia bacterium]MDW8333609.1 N-acetyl-alpha-D-glucosaminyl L-malate synthase BshA [Bacteroidia bacterium]